ncbi:MAG: phosphoribosyltransferase family protein [Nanoarchaeota archaeon]
MIKLLILDQEGTLYKDKKLLYKIRENTQEFFCKRLSINKNNYFEWYSKNKKDFPNIFEALKKFNLSIKDYHAQVFDIVNPKEYLNKDNSLFKILKTLRIPIYIVTSSSTQYSKRVLEILGISGLVKEAISLSKDKQNKIKIYNEIITKEKLISNEVCVVGDNWDIDLKDAKEEGFKTVFIGKKDEKPFIIKSIHELLFAINQFNYPKIDFFDWEKVDRIISKLESKIKSSKFYPDLIVGVARDGLIPAKLINDRFSNIDLKIVSCRRYYHGSSKENPKIQTEMLENIRSKKILLIDDVEDNGITIQKIREKLLEIGALEVKSVVLYSRAKKSNADFVGVHRRNFAIFPWNKFQELREFLETNLSSFSEKEKLRVLTSMDFSRKDVFYCIKRLTKGF